MPNYPDLYGQVYERSFKNGLAVQNQILQHQQLAEQIRQHNAEQILNNLKYLQSARQAQQGIISDTQANYTANTALPPAAEAVSDPRTTGGAYFGDADAEPPAPDETAPSIADASRSRYFQQHPTESPGPAVPYMGGSKELSPYLKAGIPTVSHHNIDPNGEEGRAARLDYRKQVIDYENANRVHHQGPIDTAQAKVQGIIDANFGGGKPEDVLGPNTQWDFVDANGNGLDPKQTPYGGTPLTGNETNVFAQATVPGKPPVRATTRAYLALNKAWGELQDRRKAPAPATTAEASPYLPAAPTPGRRVKVKGPTGALGTLPVEQLPDALKNGFTLQ